MKMKDKPLEDYASSLCIAFEGVWMRISNTKKAFKSLVLAVCVLWDLQDSVTTYIILVTLYNHPEESAAFLLYGTQGRWN